MTIVLCYYEVVNAFHVWVLVVVIYVSSDIDKSGPYITPLCNVFLGISDQYVEVLFFR